MSGNTDNLILRVLGRVSSKEDYPQIDIQAVQGYFALLKLLNPNEIPYEFKLHSAGPYCEALATDMRLLSFEKKLASPVCDGAQKVQLTREGAKSLTKSKGMKLVDVDWNEANLVGILAYLQLKNSKSEVGCVTFDDVERLFPWACEFANNVKGAIDKLDGILRDQKRADKGWRTENNTQSTELVDARSH